ncbi:MAG: type II toxin-antitoxin system HipA family toxin [Acidobacteria bacterium]|nr:type II toxin-antitoxin system HipA family toxin [Acidobacteriota bacterium]
MADVRVLDVLLHGEPVGTLTHIDGDRTIFGFADAYVANAGRPVLGLGFKDSFGELITEFRPTRTRLLPFFSNLLPEGHLRTYLAERAGVDPAREFFLLWVLGMDLPGAVTIQPADGDAWPPPSHMHADVDESGTGRRQQALRFSLAGVQLKFSALEEPRGGLTIPARGIGGSWIVKLPSREFEDLPENEFSMMTLARFMGMDVPATRLVDVHAVGNLPDGVGALLGRQALAVHRFDRLPDGSAVHTEDFAQLFDVYPEKKYENASARSIAGVLGAECADTDVAEFVRRLTFSTLIGNADMHLKNWSLLYPDRRHAALAPAYDFVATIAYIPDRTAALRFSRTKLFSEFSEDELSHLAAKAMLPERLVLDTARETVALFHQHWRAEKTHLPMGANVVRAVEEHLRTIPIA